MAAPLDARLAARLADVHLGILLASGRRTAASWFRAAGIGVHFRSYYYSLDADHEPFKVARHWIAPPS